jgi:hypothetical protein
LQAARTPAADPLPYVVYDQDGEKIPTETPLVYAEAKVDRRRTRRRADRRLARALLVRIDLDSLAQGRYRFGVLSLRPSFRGERHEEAATPKVYAEAKVDRRPTRRRADSRPGRVLLLRIDLDSLAQGRYRFGVVS